MFDRLTALGWGVVTFAVTIGVGIVVLEKFGGAVAICPAGTWSEAVTWNSATGYCENTSGTHYGTGGTGAVNTFYVAGQLGQNGLAGWTPAIIAFAVGMLFLGAFLIGGRKKTY